MTISFAKNPHKFEPVKIENTAVESVRVLNWSELLFKMTLSRTRIPI